MGKLKSRKFWVAVITAAYFGGMALKEQGADSPIATTVFTVCMAAVVVGYILIEGVVDSERIEDDADADADADETEGSENKL